MALSQLVEDPVCVGAMRALHSSAVLAGVRRLQDVQPQLQTSVDDLLDLLTQFPCGGLLTPRPFGMALLLPLPYPVSSTTGRV